MATATFTAASGSDWANAANWQNRTAPHLGDKVAVTADATIGAGEFYYGNSTLTGATLTLAPATVLAFSQLVAKNASLAGGTLQGTTLYVYGAASLAGTLLQSDVVQGSLLASDVGLSGYLTTLDNYYGTGGVWVTHALTVATSATLLGNGVTLQGASLNFGTASAQLTVGGGATLDIAPGDTLATSTAGPGLLTVDGTLAVDAGATLVMNATLSGSGSVAVAGTLRLDAPLTTPVLSMLSGGGAVLVGGTVDNTGAILDLAAIEAAVALSFGDAAGGGTLRGGTLRTNGAVLVASNTTAATVLSNVKLDGLLDFTGTLQLTNTTTTAGIRVETGATLRLASGSVPANTAVELAGGTLSAATAITLGSGVAVTVSRSSRLDGTVTLAGAVTVAAGQALTLADTSAAGATVKLAANTALIAPHTLAGTVRFTTASGQLELTGKGALSATLAGFQIGDSVRFDGMSAATVALSGTTLTLTSGATVATLRLAEPGATPYTLAEFQTASGPANALVLTTTHATAAGNPLFDAAYYMAQYGAEVTASGLDPYTHFLRIGAAERHNPDAWFDTSFYLAQNPDVAAAGINPLLHYEADGWRQNRAPSLLFSATSFLATHPASAGNDPLLAFIQSGEVTAGATIYASAATTADILVQSDYLFAKAGATLLPGTNAAAIATAFYKQGGWTTLVNPNPMFDTTFYMATHRTEVLASGLDPLTHFETIGWREGYDPSLVFSTAAYLAAHPADTATDPLTDFYTAQATPAVHSRLARVAVATATVTAAVDPLLDTNAVANQIATLLPSGGADPVAVAKAYAQGAWQSVSRPNALFDSGYYLAANPDVAAAGIDPLSHYENAGANEGRNPDPLFDTDYYLLHNPDVAAAGVNPLLHYETAGWHENRSPDALFDTAYYLAKNPDVAAAAVNPLIHFEQSGWREGRNPDALFDVRYYLSHNPDVAAANIDPLIHFEASGWHEGRNPDALFDVNYYLSHNPDVAAAGVNPLIHYDTIGWKEGRNPSATFDTRAYLAHNADVRAAGVDPLAHFLSAGQAEGRAIYAVA